MLLRRTPFILLALPDDLRDAAVKVRFILHVIGRSVSKFIDELVDIVSVDTMRTAGRTFAAFVPIAIVAQEHKGAGAHGVFHCHKWQGANRLPSPVVATECTDNI